MSETRGMFNDLPLTDPSASRAANHLAAATQRRSGPARPWTPEPEQPGGQPPVWDVPEPKSDLLVDDVDTGEAPEISPEHDWEVLNRLNDQVSDLCAARDDEGTDEEKENVGREIIAGVIDKYDAERVVTGATHISDEQHQALAQKLFDMAFRLGPLQPLLDDPTIENIHITGSDPAIARLNDGTSEARAPIVSTDQGLTDLINLWSDSKGEGMREFNAQQPRLSLTLPSGDRLQAQHPPIVPRPIAVIRCHRLKKVTLEDLVAQGTVTADVADFLRACVRAKRTIIVCGWPSAGKTTFARALCACFDPWEPVVTIETERELHLSAPEHLNVKALEARPGTGERDPDTGRAIGSVTPADLLSDALRLDTERVVYGEVRNPEEVSAMFMTMAGAAGSITTLHTNSTEDAIAKLAALQQQGLHTSPAFAYRQIQDHVHLMVQLRRHVGAGQTRMVTEVAEVRPGGDGESPQANLIFKSPAPGQPTEFIELPHDSLLEDLEQVGYDTDALRDLPRRGAVS